MLKIQSGRSPGKSNIRFLRRLPAPPQAKRDARRDFVKDTIFQRQCQDLPRKIFPILTSRCDTKNCNKPSVTGSEKQGSERFEAAFLTTPCVRLCWRPRYFGPLAVSVAGTWHKATVKPCPAKKRSHLYICDAVVHNKEHHSMEPYYEIFLD